MPYPPKLTRLLEEKRRRRLLKRYIPHNPEPRQRLFLGCEHKEALFGGAAGGGKSDALLMGALAHVDKPEYSAILFRRTLSDLKLAKSLIDRSQEWLAPTDAHWNGSSWRFPSGAQLGFGYMQTSASAPSTPVRYKSAEFQYVGFDEVSEFAEKEYLYLFSRLRRPTNSNVPTRMRSGTNPGGIGHAWLVERFGIPEEPNMSQVYEHEGRVFVPSTLSDNPHVDREDYEDSLANLRKVEYDQLKLGKWVTDASELVYGSYDKTKNYVVDLPGDVGAWVFMLGIDYGNVDAVAYTVAAFAQYSPILYVVHSEKHTKMTPTDAASRLQELEREYGGFERIVGDVGGLGKGYAEEARKHWHIPVQPAQKTNKLGYIKLFNGDLEHKKLMLTAGAAELAVEWKNLKWEDDRKLKEHPSCENHCSDSALYIWRESRHWLSQDRPVKHPVGSVQHLEQQAEERLARKIARAQGAQGRKYWQAPAR